MYCITTMSPISTILATVTVGYRQHPSLGHEGNDLVGRWGRPQATRSRAGHGRANGGRGGHGDQVRFEHVKLMWFFKWFQSQFEASFLYVFQMKQTQFDGSLKERTGIKVWELGGICGLVFTTLDLRWLYRSAQNSTGKRGDQESFDKPTPVSLAQTSWPVFLYVPCFFVLVFYSEYCWSHMVTSSMWVATQHLDKQFLQFVVGNWFHCWSCIPIGEWW